MFVVLKRVVASGIFCCLAALLPLEEDQVSLYAGEKDVLDNALHWETLAAPKGFQNRMFSSYDRTGGNNDGGWYYGLDDEDWKILADVEGPGCMVRFWSTKMPPSTDWRIRIYVDNVDEPILDAPYLDFFGNFPPFIPPLADSTTTAWCCYLPILFREHFRMTLGPPGPIWLYYHVNVIEFDDNIGVTSFTMPPSPDYQQKLDSLGLLLQTTHEPPWVPSDSIRHDTSLTIAPDSTVGIASLPGEGTIFRFEIEISPMSWERVRGLVLGISYDGEAFPRIEAPLGDLIAMGFSTEDINALGFSLSGSRVGFYFPMPFQQGALLALTNTCESAVSVEAAVSWTPREIYSTRLCAVAQVQSDLVFRKPVTLMDINERGHLVACMLTNETIDAGRLLEGDELIWVDADEQPSWNGTGTEDYFDCGYYYMGGLLSRAYFGVTYYRRANPGRHAAYRIHALDYVAFTDRLTFAIEHGPHSEQSGTYRSVLLYYAQLEKWSFEDANGDGRLYEGEPFCIHGRLLPPNVPLEFTLGEIPLTGLPGRTTSQGTYEGTALCPSMPDGDYSLLVTYDGNTDTVEAHLLVESELNLSVINLRGDTLLFPYDTLELSAFPVPSLDEAAVYCNDQFVDWLPSALRLDSTFVLWGRVQTPALPNGSVEVRLHTCVGDVQDTLTLDRRIRWEIEGSCPPISCHPSYLLYWNVALGGSLGVELRATTAGDSIVFEVPLSSSGSFDMDLFIQRGPNRGIMDVLWDDTVRVSGYDCYSSGHVRSDSISLGTMFHDGSPHLLTLRVTGKSTSSSDYRLIADQLVFTGLAPDSTYDPIPLELVIQVVGENLELRWQRDPMAANYIVWSAHVPDGPYTVLDIVSGTSCLISYDASQKRFYRVQPQFLVVE